MVVIEWHQNATGFPPLSINCDAIGCSIVLNTEFGRAILRSRDLLQKNDYLIGCLIVLEAKQVKEREHL
jgi:hypothetical protein